MSVQKWRKFMLGSLIAEEKSDKIYQNQNLINNNYEKFNNSNQSNLSQ